MYTCMCDWVTLLDSRNLTEHCKPAIMEKIKIIKLKKEKNHKVKREALDQPWPQKSEGICGGKKIFFLVFFFVFLGLQLVAYGGSQAMRLIGAVAPGLQHDHSNARSNPSLRPIPQLTATLDP